MALPYKQPVPYNLDNNSPAHCHSKLYTLIGSL